MAPRSARRRPAERKESCTSPIETHALTCCGAMSCHCDLTLFTDDVHCFFQLRDLRTFLLVLLFFLFQSLLRFLQLFLQCLIFLPQSHRIRLVSARQILDSIPQLVIFGL